MNTLDREAIREAEQRDRRIRAFATKPHRFRLGPRSNDYLESCGPGLCDECFERSDTRIHAIDSACAQDDHACDGTCFDGAGQPSLCHCGCHLGTDTRAAIRRLWSRF